MKSLLVRLSICLMLSGFFFYSYLDSQNQLTALKMRIPELDKETRLIHEETRRLAYQIDQFQSPEHLIELGSRPEFSHLQHPLLQEILTVKKALASNE